MIEKLTEFLFWNHFSAIRVDSFEKSFHGDKLRLKSPKSQSQWKPVTFYLENGTIPIPILSIEHF